LFSFDTNYERLAWKWPGEPDPANVWSNGKLTTKDVTILFGVWLDHSLIDDGTKLPKPGEYPNGLADVDRIYEYDVIKITETDMVLAKPGNGSKVNFEMWPWSGSWYWHFKKK